LLVQAVGQFARHVKDLQGDLPGVYPVIDELTKIRKGESVRATVDRLRQAIQAVKGRTIMVRATRAGEPAMNAYELLCEKAKEIRKSGDTLDEPASIAKAVAEFPELYQRYKAERRAGVQHLPTPATVTKAVPAKGVALQKIEAQAAALQKVFRENGAYMTDAEAVTQVVERHPELYQQYKAERRSLLGGQ
jgi:hypothetical protein